MRATPETAEPRKRRLRIPPLTARMQRAYKFSDALREVAEGFQELAITALNSYSVKTIQYKDRIESSGGNVTPGEFAMRAKQVIAKVAKLADERQRVVVYYLIDDLTNDVPIDHIYNSLGDPNSSVFRNRKHSGPIVVGALELIAECMGYSLAEGGKKRKTAILTLRA